MAQKVQSSDPMINKLSEFLESDLRGRSEAFCIQGEGLQIDEVSSPDGLLSLFLFKASECAKEAFKKPLPLFFESDATALIDVVPMTSASEMNLISMWTHCLHYSVEEEIRKAKREKKMQNGLIPLDDLYKQWHQAVSLQKYAIRPAKSQMTSGA